MKMKYLAHAGLMACAAMSVGCASIQPTVAANAAPDPSASYVAGTFTRTQSGGFAFVVKNRQTGEEYGMPLGEDGLLPKDVADQVIAIKVPPGEYAVTNWYTYGTLTKERSAKNAVTNPYLAAPFKVAAGAVVYLGNYLVSTTNSGSYTYWTIKPRPVRSSDAHAAFDKAYPSFSGNAFACQLCLDTLTKTQAP